MHISARPCDVLFIIQTPMKYQTGSLLLQKGLFFVTIATVIISHVKITCYFHVWRYHAFARQFTWYCCLYNKLFYFLITEVLYGSIMIFCKYTPGTFYANPLSQFKISKTITRFKLTVRYVCCLFTEFTASIRVHLLAHISRERFTLLASSLVKYSRQDDNLD